MKIGPQVWFISPDLFRSDWLTISLCSSSHSSRILAIQSTSLFTDGKAYPPTWLVSPPPFFYLASQQHQLMFPHHLLWLRRSQHFISTKPGIFNMHTYKTLHSKHERFWCLCIWLVKQKSKLQTCGELQANWATFQHQIFTIDQDQYSKGTPKAGPSGIKNLNPGILRYGIVRNHEVGFGPKFWILGNLIFLPHQKA